MAPNTLNEVVNAQSAALDALVMIGNAALASAERIAALNLHAVREAASDFSLAANGLLNVSTPADAMSWPRQFSEPQVTKSVLYSRSLVEISTAAQDDAVRLIEAQYGQFMTSMTELANHIAKVTPADSSVSVAMIRSTMKSASDAFSRFNQAVVQLTEVAEKNVSTVSNATLKATTGKGLRD